MFKRKVYDQLLAWKKEWDGKYACLLEGARRVGKTTIAEQFARNEYDSYILIDFSNVSNELLEIFDDISRLDRFFLRLQLETGVELYERKSVIIFDEIQLFPKARQAIKHLVKDGRYELLPQPGHRSAGLQQRLLSCADQRRIQPAWHTGAFGRSEDAQHCDPRLQQHLLGGSSGQVL